jgi:hypothetical protein
VGKGMMREKKRSVYALSYINKKLSKDSAGCSNENHKNFFISVVFYDYFIVMAGCNSAEGEKAKLERNSKKKLLHQSYEYLIVFFFLHFLERKKQN